MPHKQNFFADHPIIGSIVAILSIVSTVLLGTTILFLILWQQAEEDGNAALELYDDYRGKVASRCPNCIIE